MIRNFSLAFTAVSLRICMGVFMFAGFKTSYTIGCFSWIPNIILAEYYI
jgi:hypothetical protein